MIDHKLALKISKSGARSIDDGVEVGDSYLYLHRLVKEYFDAEDSHSTSWEDYNKTVLALRAAIGEDK